MTPAYPNCISVPMRDEEITIDGQKAIVRVTDIDDLIEALKAKVEVNEDA